jgi:hypothetical protein
MSDSSPLEEPRGVGDVIRFYASPFFVLSGEAVMANSNLVLHAGARGVTAEELEGHKAPPPQGRWYPLAHSRVLGTVTSTLQEAGYAIARQRLGLTKDGHRFFGTLDLAAPLVPGVALAVGVRNSTDKSFPLGFCAGNRVFVCDNLSFKSELLVRRKHTLHGERRFTEAIANAVSSLTSFREAEAGRIGRLMGLELPDVLAESLILRSFEKGVINSHQLPKVLHEWRQPSFPAFEARTAWSLLNAYTAVLGDRAATNPAQFAVQTMRLNALLDAGETQRSQAS